MPRISDRSRQIHNAENLRFQAGESSGSSQSEINLKSEFCNLKSRDGD